MSDEANTNDGATATVPHAIQIRADVKKAVSDASKSGVIRQRIVEQLTEEEIEKRKQALAAALTKRDETQREIDKIEKNPANKTFVVVPGETGKIDTKKPASGTWTDEQVQSLNKHREKLAKIDKAIEMALNPEAPDFSKLKDLN
jgi:cell division protein FtsX